MKRFVADRRSCVLATNVIELRLKYAKVAPLSDSQAPWCSASSCGAKFFFFFFAGATAARPAARPQPSPAGRRPVPGGFPGPRDRREPSGFSRCPRPGRRAPKRWADGCHAPDQRRPDQRQVPSAGHYYRG